MLKSKNVRIMLVLLIAMFLYTFVFGCGSTASNSITVTVDGEEITIILEDDGAIENLDTAVEKAVEPVLDLGDDVVEKARDTLKDVVKWGKDKNNDDDLSDLKGIGSFIDRSTQ